jgi:hypothetical protein
VPQQNGKSIALIHWNSVAASAFSDQCGVKKIRLYILSKNSLLRSTGSYAESRCHGVRQRCGLTGIFQAGCTRRDNRQLKMITISHVKIICGMVWVWFFEIWYLYYLYMNKAAKINFLYLPSFHLTKFQAGLYNSSISTKVFTK